MTKTLLNNRYQILQILGKGGFGETFLAIDTHMPSARKCVIKQLKPAIQTPTIPQWLQERFKREAAVLEELGENHLQIPRLYAYFSEGGDFYLVQEWIEGMTLTQKHQQKGNFSAEEVKKILLDLLPVLDYIHSRRIIHRDIKPDNIILRACDGKPVLIDFGVMKEAVATVINTDGTTTYSVALGTPGYMSSEQAAGRPLYSSDLYSLGLTAIFLLTGKTPQYLSTDDRTGELLWRQDLPDLDSNLAAAIDRAIRFHPRDRFSSAKEMLAALKGNIKMPKAVPVDASEQVRQVQTHLQEKTNLMGATPSAPTESENAWMQSVFGLLLFSGVMAGAFAVGYYAFSLRESSNPSPSDASPSAPFDSTPQTFPPILSPDSKGTQSPTPQPEATASPTPEVTPNPKPEATASPVPEASPTEEPEATTSPTPEASPTEEPEATTSPTPEASPTEEPEATTSPTPEASPSPPETTNQSSSPSTEATPEPSATIVPEQTSPQESKNSSSNAVPIFNIGTPESRIREMLGQPISTSKGIQNNNHIVLYKNVVSDRVELDYSVDSKTERLKRTEVSFAQTVDLLTMKETLNSLLGGKAPESAKQALEQIYYRQSDRYSFTVGNLTGTIERNQSDRIYMKVWETDFHS
ncbi:serine/threonine protein kinase [Hydrococcus rivularis NIES-593]|uniref:non-specific serine/threonine protein kinase n=1 Tax=Hydrococcus rivularis NIES-593 TaxID=1921803 RepID=A0A1U7HMI0_9CYAN|nr:serine/threonine-protein kinase [Hydrococcus rivularis]OKH24769.1 serine/threonine protein kinase [Hydrococcus rivularis NIES-593]